MTKRYVVIGTKSTSCNYFWFAVLVATIRFVVLADKVRIFDNSKNKYLDWI